MTLLEHELAALASDAFPETPDLASRVRGRLEAEPTTPARRVPRRALVLAVAAVVAAIGAAFAVPQARSTILRWFGIGGVRVEIVDELPTVTLAQTPTIGVSVSLEEAQKRVGFRVLVPTKELGVPDGVYVAHFTVDEVTLLYGRPKNVRALLTEVDGRLHVVFAQKFVQQGTRLRELSIAGRPALWIEGPAHELLFLGPDGQVVSAPLRLDKNTLLWQHGDVLLRLEGDLTLVQALRVARSLS